MIFLFLKFKKKISFSLLIVLFIFGLTSIGVEKVEAQTYTPCGSDYYYISSGWVHKKKGSTTGADYILLTGTAGTIKCIGNDAYWDDGTWVKKSVSGGVLGSALATGKTSGMQSCGNSAYWDDGTWMKKSLSGSVSASVLHSGITANFKCSSSYDAYWDDGTGWVVKSVFGSVVAATVLTGRACSIKFCGADTYWDDSSWVKKSLSGSTNGSVLQTGTTANFKCVGSSDAYWDDSVWVKKSLLGSTNGFILLTGTANTLKYCSDKSGEFNDGIWYKKSAFNTTNSYTAATTPSCSNDPVSPPSTCPVAPPPVTTYTVTYNGNGNTGGTVPPNQTKTENITLTLRTNSGTLVKTGYTFAGWNTLANGSGTNYAVGANYTANAGVTLFAKWTINTYTVTFDTNGGNGGSTATQTLTYNTGTALNANGFTRTGYTFAGWNTLANGSGTDYADTASYTIGAANVILYAKWNPLPIPTVTITANPSSIIVGTSSLLTWNATNAISCLSTGAEVLWSGSTTLATSTGSWPTGILNTTGTHTYGITCTGAGGTVSATTTVAVNSCGDNPFSDVTSQLSHNIVWTFNGRTGYFVGTITLTNDTSNLSFNGPFWYEVMSNNNWWLGFNNGTSTDGRRYVDLTGINIATSTIYVNSAGKSVYQQLQSSGDGDLVLDPGESVTVIGVLLSGRATPILDEALFSNLHVSCPAPTVTIIANPSSILAGASSTLTWNVTNAISCTATTATEETLHWKNSDLATSTGNHSWDTGILNTEGDYVYGITCAGPSGVANATTTVTVNVGTIQNPELSGGTNIDKCQAVDVSWNAYPGADNYGVMCNGIPSCDGVSTSSRAITIRGLASSTPYSFIIKAYSSGTEIASVTTASVMSGPVCTGPTGPCSILKSPTSPSVNNTTTWTVSSTCSGCTYTWSGTNINSSPAPTSNPFSKIYTTIGSKNIGVIVKNSIGGIFCTASSNTTVSFTGGTTEER